MGLIYIIKRFYTQHYTCKINITNGKAAYRLICNLVSDKLSTINDAKGMERRNNILILMIVCFLSARANLDSATKSLSIGKIGAALKYLNCLQYKKLNFSQKELWWKLKFECDYDLGNIETAKSDAMSLQQLRINGGLDKFYEAEHFSRLAMCYHFQIKADSAFHFSNLGIKLFRKNKHTVDSFEAYRIYLAHAAASRNCLSDVYKFVFNKEGDEGTCFNFCEKYIPGCFDTALYFASKLKETRNLTLAKINRSFANYYLDHASTRVIKSNYFVEHKFYNNAFKRYKLSNNYLLSIDIIPYNFLAYNYALMGLLEDSQKNYLNAMAYFNQANIYLGKTSDKLDTTASNLYVRLMINEFINLTKIHQYIETNDLALLKQCIPLNIESTRNYILFLTQLNVRNGPFRDVYNVNPMRRLVEFNLKLYQVTNKREHLYQAFFWANLNEQLAHKLFSKDSLIFLKTGFRTDLNLAIEGEQIKTLQNALKINECMLFFWDTNTDLFGRTTMAFILQNKSFDFKCLNNHLNSGYESNSMKGHPVFEQLHDSSYTSRNKYIQKASVIYYQSISKLISERIDHIILIPNKELSFIPYDILTYDKSNQPHYLLEKYSLNYLLMPGDIIKRKLYPLTINHLIILNNTTDKNGKVMYPFSNAAANDLLKLKSINTIKSPVNKSNFYKFCKDSTSIIQLFSHAEANVNNLKQTFISLSKDSLFSLDLLAERFYCPLVSLMACETDYGNYDPNAGKLSIAPILLRLGVKSILASQWLIDDKACSIIADKFYVYLVAGNCASKALRLAKLDLIHECPELSEPLYWGAFKIMGEDVSFERHSSYEITTSRLIVLVIIIIFAFYYFGKAIFFKHKVKKD